MGDGHAAADQKFAGYGRHYAGGHGCADSRSRAVDLPLRLNREESAVAARRGME